MSRKILVVGGAGYIGGITVDKLLQSGWDVKVFDNILYESRYLKPVDFVYGDVRDTNKVCEASKDCQVVILLAAIVGDPACSIAPELTEQINYLAIKNICQALPSDKHVVFMSTCSVYGAQHEMLNEDSFTSPLSTYASTKLAAEKYVTARQGTVFRLGTVFGVGDTYSRIRMDLVVNVLTMKALCYKKISIHGGAQWRPIIAVGDVASYLVEVAGRCLPGIFILSKENVLIKELGERVIQVVPAEINYTEIAFQDARNYRVDTSKADQTFKHKPLISVEDEVVKLQQLLIERRIKDPEEENYHNGAYIRLLKELKVL